MQDRHVINDSYYCGRIRQDGIISVLTANSYVVAEYDERTGNIRWPRVVNASQKESLHSWLLKNFPVIVPATANGAAAGAKTASAPQSAKQAAPKQQTAKASSAV